MAGSVKLHLQLNQQRNGFEILQFEILFYVGKERIFLDVY